MSLADEPIALDIYDLPGHALLVDELKRRYRLRGVFAEGADVEVTVAAAAAHAGLPGIPLEAALNTKNKVRMRRAFDRAGIPNPRWAEVRTQDEAGPAAQRIDLPLMVKAVDNSASAERGASTSGASSARRSTQRRLRPRPGRRCSKSASPARSRASRFSSMKGVARTGSISSTVRSIEARASPSRSGTSIRPRSAPRSGTSSSR